MAHRFRLSMTPVLTAPARLGDGWRVALTQGNRLRRRWSVDPRLFMWQLLWLPFWLGSDRPAPSWPNGLHTAALPDRAPEAGAAGFFQTAMAGLVRRFWLSWIAASVLRGVWLGLLVALAWMLLALFDLTSPPSLFAIAALAVLCACWGAVGAALNRPSAPMVASMVDRTFLLQERLTTAVDTIAPGGDGSNPRRPISRLQLADAANALGEACHHLTRGYFVPIREIVSALVVGMALLTAIFAYVPDRRLPGISQSPVPVFVPASERLADPQVADQRPVSPPQVEASAPTAAEVQEQSRSSQVTRDDLGTVGKALEDNPTTQPAADAIANGDYPAAASAIRSAASEASAMSPEGRNALAGELETAAEQISKENPELAEASQRAADDLRRGGEDAGTGLSDLGDEVEPAGARVTPPDQLARDLEEAQAGTAAEPGAPSDGQGQQNAQGQGSEGENAASQSGESADGALADPGEGVAAEPGVANPDQEEAPPGSATGQQGGETSSSQGQEGAGSAPEGAAGQPAQDPSGEGATSSGSATGEGGAEASDAAGPSSGQSQGLTGGPAEETDAAQGSGAGTGQTGANDRAPAQQGVDSPPPAEGPDPEVPVPGNGKASDRPPPGAGQPGAPGASGSVSGGSSTLELEGSSENGVRTGSDSGSSSLGSGSGAGAASGDQVQGAVGLAGPDSNRVPEDRRDIVEDYFSGPDGAP